uniref:Uncharacterized protein n=1 Tax=Rhizophora mucronata TaxID=61149 RepID=A0A2P2K649_RHIMU
MDKLVTRRSKDQEILNTCS